MALFFNKSCIHWPAYLGGQRPAVYPASKFTMNPDCDFSGLRGLSLFSLSTRCPLLTHAHMKNKHGLRRCSEQSYMGNRTLLLCEGNTTPIPFSTAAPL